MTTDDYLLAFFSVLLRVCPGIHLAMYNLFMIATQLLSEFDIKPALDEKGDVKAPSMDWPDLVVWCVLSLESCFQATHIEMQSTASV
jgi:hypothetical protein